MTRNETRGFLSTLAAYLPHYAPPTITDDLIASWHGSHLEYVVDVDELDGLLEQLADQAAGGFPRPNALEDLRRERAVAFARANARAALTRSLATTGARP